MKSQKNFIATLFIVLIIVLVVWLVLSNRKDNKLVMPGFIRQIAIIQPTPTPALPVAPKSFKFDSATDLKKELDSVNPQVLDTDFQ